MLQLGMKDEAVTVLAEIPQRYPGPGRRRAEEAARRPPRGEHGGQETK